MWALLKALLKTPEQMHLMFFGSFINYGHVLHFLISTFSSEFRRISFTPNILQKFCLPIENYGENKQCIPS